MIALSGDAVLLLFFLIVLFLIVFCFIAWRIMVRQASEAVMPDDTYICPRCNEHHCDCRKKDDA